jgi:hypothetical protein
MRTISLLALLLAAPVSSSCSAPAPAAVRARASARTAPDERLEGARFCGRTPGSWRCEADLKVGRLQLDVSSAPASARSRMAVDLDNPTGGQLEAFLRLAVPPGAAVTRASLMVGDRPVQGVVVPRARASAIYRSITERRRDPALVVWSGPEWVEISVFPVESGGRRHFELEWVEPLGRGAGGARVRAPVIAHRGRVIARVGQAALDGHLVVPTSEGWISLPRAGTEALAWVRRPGEPFGFVLARAPAEAPAARELVWVAETSAKMSAEARQRQRAAMERLALVLGEDRVTLLGGDFSTRAIAERARVGELDAALDQLDAIPSAGALDLERVLDEAVTRARSLGARQVVLFGRAEDSFGGDALARPRAALRQAGVALLAVTDQPPTSRLAEVALETGGRALPADASEGALRGALSRIGRAAPILAADVDDWAPLETSDGELVWLARSFGAAPAGAGPGRLDPRRAARRGVPGLRRPALGVPPARGRRRRDRRVPVCLRRGRAGARRPSAQARARRPRRDGDRRRRRRGAPRDHPGRAPPDPARRARLVDLQRLPLPAPPPEDGLPRRRPAAPRRGPLGRRAARAVGARPARP